jgi:16S rRNA (guanine527-N7)-methyltransferase
MSNMTRERMAGLLSAFVATDDLGPELLERLQLYLELLLRWNARVNLTAVRDPEQIVTRHFGESLFTATLLKAQPPARLVDVGAGAGFPGVPVKLLLPDCELTLIESQAKKATFLREVIRALKLEGVSVFCGRAESWTGQADVVTLRAVEKFERVLPAAAHLVAKHGRLCLLIGKAQSDLAQRTLSSDWRWHEPVPIPESDARAVAIAERVV